MRITSLRRRQNTASGNPRWMVTTDSGSWATSPDATVAHELGPEWVGRNVVLVRDQLDEITSVREVEW